MRCGLLLLVLFGQAIVLYGQEIDTDYHLTVCQITTADPPQDLGECLAPDCFRYYYEVYLELNDGTLPNIEFEELSVTTELVVDGELTQFNIGATQGCTPADFSDYIAGVEPQQAAFYMPDESGTWSFPGTSLHLFTLVVDAFPGETINVAVSATIGKGMGVANMLQVFFCTQPPEVNWPSAPACGAQSLSFQMLGGGGEDPATVSVELEGWNGEFVEEFDVAIDVTSAELMEMPWIEGVAIGAQDVEVRPRAGGGYVVYAHVRGVQWASSELFRIHLDGPQFLSLGGTITLSFRDARYRGAGTDCCQPQLGADQDVVFTGYAPCSEDVWFELVPSATNSGQCDVIWLDFFVNWTELDSAIQVYKLNVVIEVELEGDISFQGLAANALPCPAGQYYCGGADCFEQLDDHTFRYCFWSPVGEWMVPGEGLRLSFTAPAGCIEAARFREAYIDYVGGSAYVACVPERKVAEEDFPLCSPYVSGRVVRENGALVEGSWEVRYTSSNGTNQLTLQNCTDMYANCLGDPAANWMVAPYKNDNPLCGVTTYDLVLIQRHILYIQPLDSPYKLIAADANNSASVTAADMVELRKLILHQIEQLPSNTSWRFVDASYVFPEPTNPWPFPESVVVQQLPAQDVDFVAVKVGDVNLSCEAGCGMAGGAAAERASGTPWMVGVPPLRLRRGEEAVVPLYWAGAERCEAFQMGLRWDASVLEVQGWVQGALPGLSNASFNLEGLAEGQLRMLWFSPMEGLEEVNPQQGQILYGLRVRARTDIEDVSALLEADDALLPNLGWEPDGRVHALALKGISPEKAKGDSEAIAVRVTPNPWTSGPLRLRVYSRVATSGRLLVFDHAGRLLYQRRVQLDKGRQVLELSDDAAQWPEGALVWRLVTRAGSASGVVLRPNQ